MNEGRKRKTKEEKRRVRERRRDRKRQGNQREQQTRGKVGNGILFRKHCTHTSTMTDKEINHLQG